MAPSFWFKTKGTQWCVQYTEAAPAASSDGWGCRGTIGNTNLGTTELSGHQIDADEKVARVSSVFTGTPARAVALHQGKQYTGTIWRLEGVPGWNLAVWQLPAGAEDGYMSLDLVTYDAAGKEQGRVSRWR